MRAVLGVPPNDRINLTKPAQAMEVRRLSWCSADRHAGIIAHDCSCPSLWRD
jgi:hypothetical protein